jgi:hypothetical protein
VLRFDLIDSGWQVPGSGCGSKKYLALAAAGAISVWFSHAALFHDERRLPGLVIHQFLKKDWRS